LTDLPELYLAKPNVITQNAAVDEHSMVLDQKDSWRSQVYCLLWISLEPRYWVSCYADNQIYPWICLSLFHVLCCFSLFTKHAGTVVFYIMDVSGRLYALRKLANKVEPNEEVHWGQCLKLALLLCPQQASPSNSKSGLVHLSLKVTQCSNPSPLHLVFGIRWRLVSIRWEILTM